MDRRGRPHGGDVEYVTATDDRSLVPPGGGSTMLRRWTAIVLSLLLLGLAAACDEEQGDEVSVEPTPRVPGVRAPEPDVRIREIEIYDDRVEPARLTITAATENQVQVANRGARECTFFVGDYLTGLRVPAGQTAKMGLTVPVGRDGETVTMGCAGDEDRQGTAVIEFTGVLPGAGR
jgi:hypothetical protein